MRVSKPAHASHPRLADRRLLRGGVDRNNYHHPDAARPRVASCAEAWIETASTSSCVGCFHVARSEEHTSELQSLMRNSYAVFCLKKKTIKNKNIHINHNQHN